MELSGADFDNIPRGNLRVPRVEFARVWLAAERESEAHPRDWRLAGVVMTCRWIANATVRPATGRWYVQSSPVTERSASAHEELIVEECLAAELLAMRRPVPEWVANRPGWIEAVVATLNWVWRRSGVPPIDVPAAG
ncbi:hypothetical protein [Actinokineospora sp. HUAS TT18]|uniref:hypothetical protein n=1 Tax=Actinokineospora sp. HUAS TT18 TaxID=3447451 RepID=UPI003F52209D